MTELFSNPSKGSPKLYGL